jgi:hypothetical protein
VKSHENIVEAMLKAGADPNLGCGYGRLRRGPSVILPPSILISMENPYKRNT